MDTNERLKMFKNELLSIKNPEMKEFAVQLLTDADDYFFTMPASTTGKYHPAYALGDGGLVRHTRAVVFFAQQLAVAKMYSQDDTDLLTVAAIAHDIKKKGNGTGKYTTKDHPQCAAKYITEELKKAGKYETFYGVDKLLEAVESHMGQWSNPVPKTDFDFTLHCADYLASRKNVMITDGFFENTSETSSESKVEHVNEQKTEITNPGEYVLNFGKYNGKTISEINSVNPQYLEWIASFEGFNNREVKDNVKAFLASK